jgi:hypothetical protein
LNTQQNPLQITTIDDMVFQTENKRKA